jgi:hypothetical protein
MRKRVTVALAILVIGLGGCRFEVEPNGDFHQAANNNDHSWNGGAWSGAGVVKPAEGDAGDWWVIAPTADFPAASRHRLTLQLPPGRGEATVHLYAYVPHPLGGWALVNLNRSISVNCAGHSAPCAAGHDGSWDTQGAWAFHVTSATSGAYVLKFDRL